MSTNKDPWLARETLVVVLVLALGCVALLVAPSIPFNWLSGFVHELGVALVIAGILGILVDRALKVGLAQDAFRSAFGYLLPQELRGELQWIFEQKVLCVHHSAHYELRRKDGHVVIRCTLDRRLKNVSTNIAEFKPGLSIDEWQSKASKSRIITFGYSVGDVFEEIVESAVQTNTKEFGVLELQLQPEKKMFKLLPGQEAKTWAVYEECMAENDQQISVYKVPTLSPHVRITSPPELIARAVFGHREKIAVTALGGSVFQLEGLLLPNQAVLVEWRLRKEDGG